MKKAIKLSGQKAKVFNRCLIKVKKAFPEYCSYQLKPINILNQFMRKLELESKVREKALFVLRSI